MNVDTQSERIVALLGAFRSRRTSHQTERAQRMGVFFGAVARQPAVTHGFNTLAVCRVGTDEVLHSGILAWMLDSRGGHGQGSLFLQAFLETCCIPLPVNLSACRVRTEFSGANAIVDILVYRCEELLVYVENKVLAAEGDKQVDREFRDMRMLGVGLRVPENRQFAVFLTPDGRMPTSGEASRWKAVSYSAVAQAFRGVLPRITDTKASGFLQDWMDTVEAWR